MSKIKINKTGVKVMSDIQFDEWRKDNKYSPPSRIVAEAITKDENGRSVKVILQEDGQLYYVYIDSEGEAFGKYYYINNEEFKVSGTGRVFKKSEGIPSWITQKELRLLY